MLRYRHYPVWCSRAGPSPGSGRSSLGRKWWLGPAGAGAGARTRLFRWRSGERRIRQWGALLHCTGEHPLNLIYSGLRRRKKFFSASNSINYLPFGVQIFKFKIGVSRLKGWGRGCTVHSSYIVLYSSVLPLPCSSCDAILDILCCLKLHEYVKVLTPWKRNPTHQNILTVPNHREDVIRRDSSLTVSCQVFRL